MTAYRTLTQDHVDFYQKNGYLHIPNMLSEAEVRKFKEGCRKCPIGDIVGNPDFDNITLQKKVTDVIKDLLGPKIIYPGLSFTRTSDFPDKYGSRGYHTDVAYEDGDFSATYPIINTGFYLQDQTSWSGALKVIPGSHTRPCVYSRTLSDAFKKFIRYLAKGNVRNALCVFDFSRSVNIPSKAGDMLVWSTRIHHSGYGMRPRWFPNLSFHPLLEDHLPSWFFLPPNPERDVILTIYATPSSTFEGYIKEQIKKKHRKEHFLASHFEDAEVQRAAKDGGVELRNDGYDYAKNPESVFVDRGADRVSGKPPRMP